MSSSSRAKPVTFVVVSLLASAVVGACGSDETTSSPSTPDAGTGAPDGSSADSSRPDTGGGGTDSGVDSGVDSAADVVVQTNQSSWLASSNVLPSAACTPWALVDTSAGKDPVLSTGFVTLATDAEAENMYYAQGAADLITPAMLVLEARVRVGSGSSSEVSRAVASIIARYGDPLRTVALYLSTTEIFLDSANLTKGNAATVATTDAAHTYRVEIDTATHAVEVKRDSVSTITGTAFLESDGSATRTILWGEASISATGSLEWVSFTHNAHVLSSCP
jgi:hypothetical protein